MSLRQTESSLIAVEHRYPGGAYIFKAYQHAKNVMVVLQGRVRLEHMSPKGQEVYQVLDRGLTFGEEAVLCGSVKTTYQASARALEDSQVLVIRAASINSDFIKSEHGLELWDGIIKRQTLVDQLRVVRAHPARVKVAWALLNHLINPTTTERYTHQNFANEIGITREAVSRTIATFIEQGILTRPQRGGRSDGGSGYQVVGMEALISLRNTINSQCVKL